MNRRVAIMREEIINKDFSYHYRTVKKMYQDYYFKWGIILIFLLLIECISVFFYLGNRMVDGLLIIFLVVGLIIVVKKFLAFETYYEEEKSRASLETFSEDERYYYANDEEMKIAKKKSRNLFSNVKGLTFFVGVQTLKFKRPVVVCYYDLLDLTYTARYKAKGTNISFTRSRWKNRGKSFIKSIPMILLIGYIFLFRFSFIWRLFSNLFVNLLNK